MSRLTRKSDGKDYYSYARSMELTNEVLERDDKILEPEEFYKKEPYQIDIYSNEEEMLIKLGKLEDLEEELGIDVFELLQDFKKQKENLGDITKEVEVDYLAHIVLNGISYRKISEELGCPLEAVFKAIDKFLCRFQRWRNNKPLFLWILDIAKSSRRYVWIFLVINLFSMAIVLCVDSLGLTIVPQN